MFSTALMNFTEVAASRVEQPAGTIELTLAPGADAMGAAATGAVPWPLVVIGLLVMVWLLVGALIRNMLTMARVARDAAGGAIRSMGTVLIMLVGLILLGAVVVGQGRDGEIAMPQAPTSTTTVPIPREPGAVVPPEAGGG